MQIFFYQYLDLLPPLPGSICDQLTSGAGTQTVKINQSTDRKLNHQGRYFDNGKLERWRLNHSILDWLRQNITDEFCDASLQIMQGDVQGPHTDKLRRFHLYWILDPASPTVDTIWFQSKDHPVRRDEFVIYNSYDDLHEIHRARLEPGRWILFDSRVVHSVEGCASGRRCGLTVDLEYVPERLVAMMR